MGRVRALALCLSLFACRSRAGSRGDRSDVVPLDRSTPERPLDAGRSDANDLPERSVEPATRQGFVARPLGHRCTWVSDAAGVWRAEPLREVTLVEASSMLRLGCPFDGATDPWTELADPARREFSLGRDEALIELSALPGVSATLLRGTLRANVRPGSLTPLRVDTPIGRLVLTEGLVEVTVERGRGDATGPVALQCFGATVRRWHIARGSVVSEALPRRGGRRWPAEAPGGIDGARAALDAAARAIDDAQPSDEAQGVASLRLGEASVQLARRRATAPRDAVESAQRASLLTRRDELTTRLGALAR